ncbi:MAG: glycine cleavage T C-terminal barrel domain-containing protein, partial [Oscillospiraceae bacterium]
LYGHEMDDTISPLEAGLDFAVKLKKSDFIGKAALEGNNPPQRRRVGLEILGRGIVREHSDVYAHGALIGHTTSGTHCPYLGRPAAMALLDTSFTAPGTTVEVDVRGRRIEAAVVPLPFYQRAK